MNKIKNEERENFIKIRKGIETEQNNTYDINFDCESNHNGVKYNWASLICQKKEVERKRSSDENSIVYDSERKGVISKILKDR